MVVAWLSGNAS